jgi:hypothetical protein
MAAPSTVRLQKHAILMPWFQLRAGTALHVEVPAPAPKIQN